MYKTPFGKSGRILYIYIYIYIYIPLTGLVSCSQLINKHPVKKGLATRDYDRPRIDNWPYIFIDVVAILAPWN